MSQTAALLFWGVITLFLLVIEALTPQLLSIWFATGALCALFVAALGGEFWLQASVWLVVSSAMLVAMRPLSRRFKERRVERMNATRIIGRHGITTTRIDPDLGGQIRIDGAVWTVKCADETPIEEGVRVTVLRIEGVKAVVRLSRVQPEDEVGTQT